MGPLDTNAQGERGNQQVADGLASSAISTQKEAADVNNDKNLEKGAQTVETPEAKAAREANEAAKKRVEAERLRASSELSQEISGTQAEESLGKLSNSTKTDKNTEKPLSPVENKVDPNANYLSKNKWGAAALDLARGMVVQTNQKDQSFFDKAVLQFKYFGLRLINAFTGPFWYKDLSPEAKAVMQEKFGLIPKDNGNSFDWGEAGEVMGNFLANARAYELLKLHFEGNSFSELQNANEKAFVKDGITFAEFKLENEKNSPKDSPFAKKCAELAAAMNAQNPPPNDTDKFYDYLGKHSNEVAVSLKIDKKLDLLRKNEEGLSQIKDTPRNLRGEKAAFEYTKFAYKDETENEFGETKVMISKEIISVDGKPFKIKEPAGATIQSIEAKEGGSDHALQVTATISVNGKTQSVENFLGVIPDGSNGMKMQMVDASTLILENAPPIATNEPSN